MPLVKSDGVDQSVFPRLLNELDPVSYTHLDVYKRQVLVGPLEPHTEGDHSVVVLQLGEVRDGREAHILLVDRH